MENCSGSRFLITVLWISIISSVNGPAIFLETGNLVHPRRRVSNLVTWYELPEVSFLFQTKNHTCMMRLGKS